MHLCFFAYVHSLEEITLELMYQYTNGYGEIRCIRKLRENYSVELRYKEGK